MMENKQVEARFNPSVAQVAFANAYILHKGNITKACQAIGDMRRNKYYGPNGLRYKEGFEIWLSEYVKKEVMRREGKWYLIAEKFAEAGSYKHLELLFTLAHKFDDPKDMPTKTIVVHYRDFKSEGDASGDVIAAPKNPPPKS